MRADDRWAVQIWFSSQWYEWTQPFVRDIRKEQDAAGHPISRFGSVQYDTLGGRIYHDVANPIVQGLGDVKQGFTDFLSNPLGPVEAVARGAYTLATDPTAVGEAAYSSYSSIASLSDADRSRLSVRAVTGVVAAVEVGDFTVGALGEVGLANRATNGIIAVDAPNVSVPQTTPQAVRTNAQLIQDVATRADQWGTRQGLASTGSVPGTLKHGYADRLLTRYQQMYGDRGLSTEVRYLNGRVWQPGMPTKGSILLDVVEGPVTAPTQVFDYKFGGATLKPPRIVQIRAGAGLGPGVPVIEVKP